MTKLLPCLFVALALPGLAAAQEPPAYIGDSHCRIARLEPPPQDGDIQWSGQCKDGYAEGSGALTWSSSSKRKLRLEGTLVRGELAGEGTLTYEKGSYIGTLKSGVPHGQGFFKSSGELAMYEGDVVAGKPEGAGVAVYADRSRYEGQWQAGRRHGTGRATFSLGGSYEGEWKNDKFDGQGVIIYAGSGHRYEGRFSDGRVAGIPQPEIAPAASYILKQRRVDTGSNIPGTRAQGYLPMRASWTALTPAQQNKERSFYPALEAGDEPPFPADGTAALYETVGKVADKFLVHDELRLHILVGADGVAKAVTTIGTSDPEFIKYLSMATMVKPYKPAMCRGQPCDMIYQVRFLFRTEL